MGTLERILLLAAAAAAWPCWRLWFYPKAPFQAARQKERRALHANRLARWSAGFTANTQRSAATAERTARAPYETQMQALQKKIQQLKNPGHGAPLTELGTLVLHQRGLLLMKPPPGSEPSSAPEIERAFTLPGLRVRPGPDERRLEIIEHGRSPHWVSFTQPPDITALTAFLNTISDAVDDLPALKARDTLKIAAADKELRQLRTDADAAAQEATTQHRRATGELAQRRKKLHSQRRELREEWEQLTGGWPR
jgi:hypothetical protein